MSLVLDPWNRNFILPENSRNIKIKVRRKNKEPHEILFFYRKNRNGNIEIISKSNENHVGYENLKIKIQGDTAKIVSLQKSDEVSGTEFMELGMKILKRLRIKTCILQDIAKFDCKNKNIYSQEIPSNILLLFKKCETFYMRFGFLPYNINTGKCVLKEIMRIIFKLYFVSWEDVDNFIKMILEKNIKINKINRMIDRWNEFKNKFMNTTKTKENINRQIEEYNKKFGYIFGYLNKNSLNNNNSSTSLISLGTNNVNFTTNNLNLHPIQFNGNIPVYNNLTELNFLMPNNVKVQTHNNNENTPFSIFIKQEITSDCGIYLDWLELYGLTSSITNNIYYNVSNEIRDRAGVKLFSKLKDLLKNVEWKCIL